MVTEHQARGFRALAAPYDLHLASEQRIVDVVHADDPAALQHDRVLDLRVAQFAVGSDRGIRADVRVDELRARADDRRTAHNGGLNVRTGFDDDPALDARSLVDVTVDTGDDRVEDETV